MFLALLGVAAARPQFIYPFQQPLVTLKTTDYDGKVIKPMTYTYPTTTFGNVPTTTFGNFPITTLGNVPITYSGYPYNWPFSPITPVITNTPVVEKKTEVTRTKRAAEPEPEPEADPLTVYTTGVVPSTGVVPTTIPIAGTTTYNYPMTYPLTYSYPYSFPYTFPFNYAKVVKTV